MSHIIVYKAGGTSVGNTSGVLRLGKIHEADTRRKVLVVSAAADTQRRVTKMLNGIVDTVLASGKKDLSLAEPVNEFYEGIYSGSTITEGLHDELKNRIAAEIEDPAGYRDSIIAFGEEWSGREAASLLGVKFIDPKELFLLSNDFGRAKILPESRQRTRERLGSLDDLVVVAGFYGATPDGKIATLGHGSSDLTATTLGDYLNADVVEIYSDKVGVLSAPPNIVQGAKKIDEITFREQSPFSYAGAGIVQRASLGPAYSSSTGMHIRGLNEFPEEGTHIRSARFLDPEKPIIGVTYEGGFCAFEIERFGLEEIGLQSLLGVFSDAGVAVETIPSGFVDDVSIPVRRAYLDGEKIGSISKGLKNLLDGDASLEFKQNLGVMVVVGEGMRDSIGISARVQGVLADTGVSIKGISQSTSEASIAYSIAEADSHKAVNAMYNAFIR